MAEIRPVVASHVSSRGPRFFRADEEVMFEITLDHRSKIGPRPATEEDARRYPQAWEAFATGVETPPQPTVQAVDIPQAKADAEAQKAERQRRMDAKRGGGL